MTAKEALEVLKNRTAALSLNHKIGSRDIAKQEVKEIVMSIKTHVIPTLEKSLTELEELKKTVKELLDIPITVSTVNGTSLLIKTMNKLEKLVGDKDE